MRIWSANATADLPVAYDAEADVLRLRLMNTAWHHRHEINPGLMVDYDEAGNIIAVELQQVTNRLPLQKKSA